MEASRLPSCSFVWGRPEVLLESLVVAFLDAGRVENEIRRAAGRPAWRPDGYALALQVFDRVYPGGFERDDRDGLRIELAHENRRSLPHHL